jgi:hypothetical protein
MISHFAVYDSRGLITGIVSCPKSMGKLQGTTERPAIEVPETVTDSNSYIAAGEVLPKQPFNLQMTNPQIAADGVDECVIGNVPTGTSVEWPDGQTDEVTDGEARFSVDLAGTYTLRFSAIPYLDEEVTIEAVIPT